MKMYKSIEEFLSALKKELKGNDTALIQDVLSDAEEHIRTAVDNDVSNVEALNSAIENYGDPGEIIAEYKKMDEYLKPAFAKYPTEDTRPGWKKFLMIIADPAAWGASLYMLFSLVTGIVFFTWVITGLSVTIPFLIFVIGIPLVGIFLLSIQGVALLEGKIVEALLGTRMPRKPMFVAKDKGAWKKFKALVSSGVTWKTMAYMVLQMPLGIIYFTLVVTLFSVSLSFIAAPILELIFGFNPEIHSSFIFPEEWLIVILPIVGIFLFLVTLHLAKLIGKLHGMFAKLMLVRK